MKKRFSRLLLAVMITAVIIISAACAPVSSESGSQEGESGQYTDIYDLEGCRMGQHTGSNTDKNTAAYIDCENIYYDTYVDEALALQQEKIDGFLCDEPAARGLCLHNSDIGILDELYGDNYAFVTAKTDDGNRLCDELNDFLLKSEYDGTMTELEQIWFGSDDSLKTVYIPEAADGQPTLVLGSELTSDPCEYIRDGRPVGYEIDLMARFCSEYGYGLDIADAKFASLIPGVESGKYDVVCGMLSITEERKQRVNMTEPVLTGGMVVMVLKKNIAGYTEPEYTDVSELEGKRIGAVLQTYHETLAEELVENPEIVYFNTYSDMAVALEENKIDAFFESRELYQDMVDNGMDVKAADIPVASSALASVFPYNQKGQKLLTEFNGFLYEINADGRYDELLEKWTGGDESLQTAGKLDSLEGGNGTLTLASAALFYPYAFVREGAFSGLESDLLYEFCKERGYDVVYMQTDFADVISGVSQGIYDIGMNGITVTEERAQDVAFSDAYLLTDELLVSRAVKYDAAVVTENIFETLAGSFYSNVILENRWQLILSGLGVTLILTALSVAGGTLLGFGLFRMRVCRYSGVSTFERGLVRAIQGIPVVVLLMVLYYIAFAGVSVDAILVACIGFSLNFGVYTSEIIRSGASAVGTGQREAACALGFDDRTAFRKIVLPQIINNSMPVYRGEVITLMKSTSVAGYIAVQDLTKVADIIRSRTFDAFFPIIITAVIYFALSLLLAKLLGLIQVRTDPKQRKHVLKDVDRTASYDDQPLISGSGDEGETIISIKGLVKQYESVTPLDGVDADIRRGDVISVIGPSGTGKSTLLRCINRLEQPTSGRIYAFGQDTDAPGYDLCKMRSKIGMVFQSFNLFAHLTVIENIMLAPVLLNKEPQQQAYNRGMALLKRVGLADRAFNYPDELSGGQQQRAAIVRALAMNPGAILFDEPTSALDPMMTGEVTAVIKELAENGLTMMIVTHEMDFARDVSTRVFYMDGGGICEQGSPETLFDNPENERTMAFVRKIRLFTRNIESDSFDYLGLRQNIIAFCMEMFVSRHMTYSLVHCLEECVMHGLLKDSGVEYPVSLSVGYGQDSGLVLTLSYRGGNADIRKTMDEISLKMINQYSCGIEISSNGSENRAVMRIKD